MFYKGLGGKAVPPRKAFLLNRGLLHTNRHKLACCLNRILAITIYPAGVSWVWCCLKLVVCFLSCHLRSSSALYSLAQKAVPGRLQRQEQCPVFISDSSMCRLRTQADLANYTHLWITEVQRKEATYCFPGDTPSVPHPPCPPDPPGPPSPSWYLASDASLLTPEWLYLRLSKDLIWPLIGSVPLHTGVWK